MQKIILQINEFLKKHNWCDFSIIYFDFNLEIGGSTSFSETPDIKIIFEDVFYLQCLYEWKTDTSQDVFFISSIEECKEVNIGYSIEEGYYLFRILAEDIERPMYISARNIKFEILK